MQCYWCAIVEGTPVLKEHEAARWLDLDSLDSVAWLPADLSVVELIREKLSTDPLPEDPTAGNEAL
jgi:8-oxo-dGTP diphosphatase